MNVSQQKKGILGLSELERDIGFVNTCVSFGFALLGNSVLCYLVTTRSTTLLKSYQKVFYFHMFVDMSLSLIFFLTMCQPVGARFDNKLVFFHIIDGIISHPPQPWTSILASTYLFLVNYNISTAAVSFIYRYFLICHDYEIRVLPFFGLIISAGILPFVYGVLVLENELGARSLEPKLAVLFNNTDWIEADGELPVFGILISDSVSFSSIITPLTIALTYGIVIYCATKMALKVRTIQQFKIKHNQQHQLQIVILFQALIPFFTSGLATFAIQMGRILNLPQPWWYFYANLLNTWSPVVNPGVALFVIAPYRKFVLYPIFGKSKKSGSDDVRINYDRRGTIRMTKIMSDNSKVSS